MEKFRFFHQSLTKGQILFLLFIFPFVVTLFERNFIKPIVSIFSLPDTSIYMLKVGSITLLLFSVCAFVGNTFGFEITRRVGKAISGMFLALIAISFYFLLTLQVRGLFDDFAVSHLFNWMVSVLREELILRGIIQTQASYLLRSKFLRISHSIWASTIIFSLWHLVNLTVWPWQVVALQMLSCIPSGIVLGLIREKTGNTLLTYLLHISGDLLFFSTYTLIFGKLFFSLY